jgi:outer membrane protein assembly factor BamD (BamD/ComL family)
MSNLLKTAGLTLFAALLIFGCKKGDQATLSVGETELFAKAQDLQKEEKYDEAVKVYRQIARDFSKTKQGANSQFMVGYIYANHIRDYEQAKIELNRFIEEFGPNADSGLVAGARFELEWMGKDIEEIPILANIGEGSGGADTTAKIK